MRLCSLQLLQLLCGILTHLLLLLALPLLPDSCRWAAGVQ